MGPNVASRGEDMGEGVPSILEPGACYLIAEKRPDTAYRLFNELVRNGAPGLVVSRLHPFKVRLLHGVTGPPGGREDDGRLRILWLCHTLGEDFVNPAALGSLYERLTAFAAENPDGIILIDGLEYIQTHNDFRRALTFVEDLNEFVAQRGPVVLVPVDPKAFEEQEFALLARELEVRDSADIKSELDIRDIGRRLGPS